jgi:hypothetical protein
LSFKEPPARFLAFPGYPIIGKMTFFINFLEGKVWDVLFEFDEEMMDFFLASEKR